MPARKAERQPSRQPDQSRRRSEDSQEEDGLGGEGRPENIGVADRGKPQPVDNKVSDTRKRDYAGDDKRNLDRNASPVHAAPPSPGVHPVQAGASTQIYRRYVKGGSFPLCLENKIALRIFHMVFDAANSGRVPGR